MPRSYSSPQVQGQPVTAASAPVPRDGPRGLPGSWWRRRASSSALSPLEGMASHATATRWLDLCHTGLAERGRHLVSLEMATFSQDHPTDWSCLCCRGGPHVDAPSRMVAGLGGPFDGCLEGGGAALTFCVVAAL